MSIDHSSRVKVAFGEPTVGPMARLLAHLRRRLTDESGGIIIEVVVSAAILLTVAGSVLLAIDAAAKQSAMQRDRAVAANFATTQLEKMRSQKFSDVAAYVTTPLTDTATVGGNTYTFTNRAQWVGAGTPSAASCSAATRSPERLRVSTEVSWEGMGNAKPVTMSSVIPAPASGSQHRGTVVVQVTDEDGFGVGGLLISLTGPVSASATTDDNGCVRFSDLTPDNYEVSFSDPPKQTPDGVTDVVLPVIVLGGQTQSLAVQYDAPAATNATVSWYFKDYSVGGSPQKPAPVKGVSWRRNPGQITTQNVNPASATVEAPGSLSASTYKVYADTCTSANPTALTQNIQQPGGVESFQLPAARIRAYDNGTIVNGPVPGVNVWFTSPCGTKYGPYVTDGNGYTPVIGLPYNSGAYTVCISHPSFPGYRKRTTMTVTNYNGLNQPPNINASGAEPGNC